MFDKELFYKRYKEETQYNDLAIERRYQSLSYLHPEVLPLVESWLAGEHEDFEFSGISLQEIMEKEHDTYLDALFSMSAFLRNPETVSSYSSYEYYYDVVGDELTED